MKDLTMAEEANLRHLLDNYGIVRRLVHTEEVRQEVSLTKELPLSQRKITGKTLTLSFRLGTEEAFRVERICERLKWNRSQFFKQAILQLLEEKEREEEEEVFDWEEDPF